jgi:hypothetical protein
MRKEFEERNGHRAWFVAGGREDTGPEGYVYDDFTTDMCWTCWVDSRESLVIELPPQQAFGPHPDDWGYPAEETRTAIEAAGLKVKS